VAKKDTLKKLSRQLNNKETQIKCIKVSLHGKNLIFLYQTVIQQCDFCGWTSCASLSLILILFFEIDFSPLLQHSLVECGSKLGIGTYSGEFFPYHSFFFFCCKEIHSRTYLIIELEWVELVKIFLAVFNKINFQNNLMAKMPSNAMISIFLLPREF
jgi:hypothetical protein